jgi:hypothetical protein
MTNTNTNNSSSSLSFDNESLSPYYLNNDSYRVDASSIRLNPPEPIKKKPIHSNHFNLNTSINDLSTNKNKIRYIPLLEHEIKHVFYNIPNINSNRDAAKYLNVSWARFRKYATLYTNAEFGHKTYFQLFTDRSNKLKGARLIQLKELKRKKAWGEWYKNNIINKLNSNNLDVKHYTQKKLKEFLFIHNIIPARCACCGYAERNMATGKVPLLIDHINNDWKDFRIDNLQMLCYNCFAQLVGNPLDFYMSKKDYL